MLHQGCSLFNRSNGVRDQRLQYKCSELNLTQTHAPTFPSLPALLRLGQPWNGPAEIQGKKQLLHYFLGALKVTALAWMLRLKFEHSPYKLGGGHCRFEKLWGKNSLNATLNGRSHYNKSAEPLIWGLFDHSPSESYPSLSLFCWYLRLSLSVSLSCSEPNRTHSQTALYNLWCSYICCTIARCSVQHYSIKWIISEHLWPLTGLWLAMNQEVLRRHGEWHRPLWKLAGLSDR